MHAILPESTPKAARSLKGPPDRPRDQRRRLARHRPGRRAGLRVRGEGDAAAVWGRGRGAAAAERGAAGVPGGPPARGDVLRGALARLPPWVEHFPP